MGKHKKFKPITLYLEHDTKKPITQKMKTSGLGGIRFATKIAGWMKQGYQLVKAEGDPQDPVYQYIQKTIASYNQVGKATIETKEIIQVASKSTGGKVEDIQGKMDSQLNKWKKRFKGVMPQNG